MRLADRPSREVLLVPHDPRWPERYAEELPGLRQAFGTSLVALEHIGSTSVPGLAAKPVIDIQVLVQSVAEAKKAVPALAAIGWEQGVFTLDPEEHLYFKKNDADGRRTHQLHVYAPDHPAALPHRLFRDYLRAHPEEAQWYEALKRQLAERFRTDRIAYAEAKSDYVATVLAKARE